MGSTPISRTMIWYDTETYKTIGPVYRMNIDRLIFDLRSSYEITEEQEKKISWASKLIGVSEQQFIEESVMAVELPQLVL